MRCFVAIPLPKELKDTIHKVASSFSPVKGLRFVQPDNMHLTLFFLGDVKNVESLVNNLRNISVQSFSLRTTSVGFFKKPEDISALWFGVENSEELFTFWAELNKLFCQEREFIPHITFARVKKLDKDSKKILLEKINSCSIKSFTFKPDSFKLYSSELTSLGPVHRVIESFPLK